MLTHALRLAACLLPLSASAQTLMSLPGAEVSPADVSAVAQKLQEASRSATLSRESNVQRVAEEVLLRRKLAAQAEETGLTKDPVLVAQARQAQERVLSDARLVAYETAATPAPDVLRRYAEDLYRADPARYDAPGQIRARHILISPARDANAKARAQSLLDQLRKGASFDTLAAQNSVDEGTKARGGDLGWFNADAMVKEFSAAASALKAIGDLSEVVETQYGYHVIRLDGRRPPVHRSFEEVRPQIEQEVVAKLRGEARQELVRSILKDAKSDTAAIEALARSYSKP